MVTKNEVICESIHPPPPTTESANDPTEIPSMPIPLGQVNDDDETKGNGANMIFGFNFAAFILLAVINFA